MSDRSPTQPVSIPSPEFGGPTEESPVFWKVLHCSLFSALSKDVLLFPEESEQCLNIYFSFWTIVIYLFVFVIGLPYDGQPEEDESV